MLSRQPEEGGQSCQQLQEIKHTVPAVSFSVKKQQQNLTCHGISPGITTSPPTMRLCGLGLSSVLFSLNLLWLPAESSVTGIYVVVAAVVEGGDVVVLKLVSDVVFSRLVLSWPSRVLVETELTSFRAVLPHGNSAGDGRKQESHNEITSPYHEI